MKHFTIFSLVMAALLFTACGEKTKEATTNAASAVTEAVKEDAALVVEATKAKASEVSTAAVEKATSVKEATEAKVAEVTETVKTAVALDNAAGKSAYASCIGCHGADGQTKALGKGAPVAGQTVEALVDALNGYKAGTRNVAGMGTLMKGQVSKMDDATITAVSEYMSGL